MPEMGKKMARRDSLGLLEISLDRVKTVQYFRVSSKVTDKVNGFSSCHEAGVHMRQRICVPSEFYAASSLTIVRSRRPSG